MQIEKNTIIMNGSLYKVIDESKLYWIVNPLKVIDEFKVDENVLLMSMDSSTYIKYSIDTSNNKEKVLKSRVNCHSIIDSKDVEKYYFQNCYNKYEINDRDKYIQACEIQQLIRSCTNNIVLRECEKGRQDILEARNDMIIRLKSMDKNKVKTCLKQFEKDDYAVYYKKYKKLVEEL